MKSLPELFRRHAQPALTSNPYRDMLALQRHMDRMFDRWWPTDALEPAAFSAPAFMPSCDVEETDSHYLMSFDLPGVKKDNIKIDLRDGALTVSGEREEEHNEKKKSGYQSERFYGSFFRSFQVPETVKAEQIEAAYNDGVLRLAVPKALATQVQSIQIGEGKSSFWERLGGQKKRVDSSQQPPPQGKRPVEKVA